LLALFWGWLAIGRARATDPRRTLREAHGRMAAALAQLRSTSANPAEAARQAGLLLGWQHDTAILLKIPHAAPVSGHLASSGDSWKDLWEEADRALYGAEHRLPPDWVSRAEAAWKSHPPPRFARRQLFLFRNLFPFLAALGLVFAAGASQLRAQESASRPLASGSSLYRRGDFHAAEAAWRRALAPDPKLPVTQYNLSLALAQQDRWDEAAAHASAAFVQDPDNDAIRWQFALACSKAGYAPAPLVGFVAPGPVQRLARIASPGAWQWTMISASALFSAAAAFGLARSYRGRPGARPALFLAVLALLLLLAATVGWRAYGGAADPGAVVVWRTGILRSIPTEADLEQKTTPLAAGVVANVNKSFLGWLRLSFENGETGWVRAEETVPLWEPALNHPQ
jgi:tetratricopeptide (TPR) repeat protein